MTCVFDLPLQTKLTLYSIEVTGLHHEGYGLLLRQSNFSAGVMYTMWISLGRERDPFIVLPCIPVPEELEPRGVKGHENPQPSSSLQMRLSQVSDASMAVLE